MHMNKLSETKTRINSKKSTPFLRILLKGVGTVVLVFALCYAVLWFWPPAPEEMPFFQAKEAPLVIAHQGGNKLAPSSTNAAFAQAVELGVDVLEYDVHITQDGFLVTIHDPTVDRTTNGQGKVEDFTLAEIQALDAGYTFQDLAGNYSYKGQGVYIPTVEELFERYGDLLHNIEIKDTNSPEKFEQIYKELWRLIQAYDMQDKVLIASFDHQMIRDFQELTGGQVAVSGGRKEITKFVAFNKFWLAPFYRSSVQAVQIPTESDGFNLVDPKLIKGAKRLNMQVHYWTINDPETMRELLELGADGIITDRPDILIEVIQEYQEGRGKR